jgi:hypothetical protein
MVESAISEGDACDNQTAFAALEHDPEKWKPVFRKDHGQGMRS